ncbi:uncharacterized protein [Gossypium hirsutum]|uniref:Uncharacterized protein n=1 Tax=Gossypium hirsutum TaxID=3635 RepID=A0A1U8NGI1_GOSHI|nr:uncharacterized protein LOC107948194 [Gossypium hirsutum]
MEPVPEQVLAVNVKARTKVGVSVAVTVKCDGITMKELDGGDMPKCVIDMLKWVLCSLSFSISFASSSANRKSSAQNRVFYCHCSLRAPVCNVNTSRNKRRKFFGYANLKEVNFFFLIVGLKEIRV